MYCIHFLCLFFVPSRCILSLKHALKKVYLLKYQWSKFLGDFICSFMWFYPQEDHFLNFSPACEYESREVKEGKNRESVSYHLSVA